jgi:hypothetical protein
MAVDFRITAIYAEDLEEWYRKVRQITDSVSQHAVAKYGDDEHKELEFEYNRQSFRVEESLDHEGLEHIKGNVWFTRISPRSEEGENASCCRQDETTRGKLWILIAVLGVVPTIIVLNTLIVIILLRSAPGITNCSYMKLLCAGVTAGKHAVVQNN